jgi:MFS family permease
MTIIDLTIVNVSLPTIGRDLHFSATYLQWVVTAYALTFGGLLVLGGRAADLIGRRRVMLGGLALFTAASLACALATGEGFLIASRAVQAIGAAIMLPAALSIVMHMFSEGADRDKALGIWGGLGAGGATVGLIAGGVLTRYAGWQYIFYLNVPIGAAALALAPRIVPDSRADAARRRFDAGGAIVGTGGLVLLVDAITQAPRYGWGSTRTLLLLAASLLLLAAFLVMESRVQQPVLPLSIFRLRTLAGANIAGLVLAGLSQLLVTRGGPRLVMAAGMTLISGGILWATRIPVHGRFLADLAAPLIVVGAGTAFAFIPISIAALTGIADRQAGLASGLLSTSQQLGGAIGVAIATSIAAGHTRALLQAGHDAPTALTGGYQHALWGLGAVALLALPAIFALVGRDRPETESEIGLPDASPALAGTR